MFRYLICTVPSLVTLKTSGNILLDIYISLVLVRSPKTTYLTSRSLFYRFTNHFSLNLRLSLLSPFFPATATFIYRGRPVLNP